MEGVLTDSDEVLFCQVNPGWLVDDEPSSQAFRPTPKDEGMLSVSRGSMTTAEAAYRLHAEERQLRSAGTWGVTVGEAQQDGLAAVEDPLDDDPAHAFIDYRGLGRGATEARAKVLRSRARERGALFRPSN